jgi:hypothetical protein
MVVLRGGQRKRLAAVPRAGRAHSAAPAGFTGMLEASASKEKVIASTMTSKRATQASARCRCALATSGAIFAGGFSWCHLTSAPTPRKRCHRLLARGRIAVRRPLDLAVVPARPHPGTPLRPDPSRKKMRPTILPFSTTSKSS